MKSQGFFSVALLASLMLSVSLTAQPQFNLTEYKAFLEQHQNMSTSHLLEMHPAGLFGGNVQVSPGPPAYLDSIINQYEMTEDEISLLHNHGFVVTERLRQDSFGAQLMDIYQKDLPVFISTDAILHAFHNSYDRILRDIEVGVLLHRLTELLDCLHSSMQDLASMYSTECRMDMMLKDVDVYVTVPRKLFGQDVTPYFPENRSIVDTILGLIEDEQLATYPLFSESCRLIDFSQFKPRGHYDDEVYPELADYFRAMMWFGRIELYLLAPGSYPLVCPTPSDSDIQRQVIDATLLSELIEMAGVYPIYEEIEDIIRFFVGEQDNVTLPDLRSVLDDINVSQAGQLLDPLTYRSFRSTLANKPFASQQILSQVLIHDPFSPDSITPASAFMLFGQRFVIDSYVTGSVVFDRITYNDQFIMRMLPSTLDILFALGNNAAAQLLVPELDTYHYSTNLAALRYLVDSYDDDFWYGTLYNSWLHSIRALNPPSERENLPQFMQTAAWWQQKLNTQLSSWAELRHDNLLYAKQSYTGGTVCSFPYGYVEPIPEFYNGMHLLAETAIDRFQDLPFTKTWMRTAIIQYFETLSGVNDTLYAISTKELSGTPRTGQERLFLKRMLKKLSGSGPPYDGWYTNLFYLDFNLGDGFFKKDFLIADYHTQPTDESGHFVGKVAHAGTGPVDMVVVVADLPGYEEMAFIGPVMGYYEYTTTNFLRLTDDEWAQTYQQSALRPDWVNIYLADRNGESRGDGPTLFTTATGTNDDPHDTHLPPTYIIARNYPNPFNAGTMISFTVPYSLSHSLAELAVYNIQGQVVKRLLREELPSGNYLTRWDGTNTLGQSVSSGIYFYSIKVGRQNVVGKMSLLK